MPLNAQAEIARVLAIEPEGSQADAIRQFVRDELGAELMLVSSAYAAVVAINRQTPDVVLFSESVSEKHRDRVLDHLRSTIAPAVPQRMTLPPLRSCDRALLAQQINAMVARAQEARPRSAAAPAAAAPAPPARAAKVAAPPLAVEVTAPPPKPVAAITPLPDEALALPAFELSTTSAPEDVTEIELIADDLVVADDLQVDAISIESDTDDSLEETVASLNAEEESDELVISIDHIAQAPSSERRPPADDAVDPEVHAAEIALVQAMADAKLAAELERVRAEAAEQRTAELARIERESATARDAAVAEARLAAEAEARESLNVELTRV